MAVTKRLRFEILRRDNHACRYCGRSAPDVRLTVDHVVPTALGGSDEPTNLVAACADCNSGKSSVPAGAELVADVAADALRWAAAMTRAIELADAVFTMRDERRKAFYDLWSGWHTTTRRYDLSAGKHVETKHEIKLENGWEQTIDRFYLAGLSHEQIADCVHIAMGANNIPADSTWRYFCGVAWKRVRQIQDVAADLIASDEPPTVAE